MKLSESIFQACVENLCWFVKKKKENEHGSPSRTKRARWHENEIEERDKDLGIVPIVSSDHEILER